MSLFYTFQLILYLINGILLQIIIFLFFTNSLKLLASFIQTSPNTTKLSNWTKNGSFQLIEIMTECIGALL